MEKRKKLTDEEEKERLIRRYERLRDRLKIALHTLSKEGEKPGKPPCRGDRGEAVVFQPTLAGEKGQDEGYRNQLDRSHLQSLVGLHQGISSM